MWRRVVANISDRWKKKKYVVSFSINFWYKIISFFKNRQILNLTNGTINSNLASEPKKGVLPFTSEVRSELLLVYYSKSELLLVKKHLISVRFDFFFPYLVIWNWSYQLTAFSLQTFIPLCYPQKIEKSILHFIFKHVLRTWVVSGYLCLHVIIIW